MLEALVGLTMEFCTSVFSAKQLKKKVFCMRAYEHAHVHVGVEARGRCQMLCYSYF